LPSLESSILLTRPESLLAALLVCDELGPFDAVAVVGARIISREPGQSDDLSETALVCFDSSQATSSTLSVADRFIAQFQPLVCDRELLKASAAMSVIDW
jgi:hypothetical protein